jgi:hypothetical protein
MPLRTKTVDLEDEYHRLTDEMDRYAEEQADYDRGTDGAQVAAAQGQRAERLRAGVAWAMDYPGHDDINGSGWDVRTITVGSLTNGDRHLVNDISDERGYKRADAYVAAGTVDAPFMQHDADERTVDEFKATVQRIPELHPSFVDWLEDRITDVSQVGEEGKSYLELVQEKRSQENSPEKSG